ncbi:hypothetical protein [Candidatus Oscillochloris fontis]|uniref:hypothetical protein n=1 Tax=Candidatus Oscillochloris fontis TaxID=2496868 RepID=UPI00101D35AA|nr:hypothetical protein [Candidatus Oscillochloris fontis]
MSIPQNMHIHNALAECEARIMAYERELELMTWLPSGFYVMALDRLGNERERKKRLLQLLWERAIQPR